MKAHAGCILVGLAGMIMSGCPIYSNEVGCFDNYDCSSGYYCNDDNVCVKPPRNGGGAGTGGTHGQLCRSPDDCWPNETCGADGICHSGDCYFSGCVDNYECILDGYQYVCVPIGMGGAGGGGAGGGGAGGGGTGGGGPGGSGTGGSGTGGGGPGGSGTGGSGTGGGVSEGGSAGSAGNGGSGGSPAPVYCGNPKDCPSGEVCSDEGLCEEGTCTDHGCVHGYVCEGGDPPSCVPENAASCIEDEQCSGLGAGFKCVNGICTAPADQCTDKTQCPDPATQSCVDGKCIAACDEPTDCPNGYICEDSLGICTDPALGCTITQDCNDPALVCVAGACVERCGPSDTCTDGYICVANGCVPDQKPSFICTEEGVQDVCNAGSICLHHSCYLACTPDPNSCAVNPPDLNECKSVTTPNGAFDVCGSSSNLGSDCDPTVGNDCSDGKICIDGFCR